MPRPCPVCGRYNPAQWDTCKKCGTVLPPVEQKAKINKNSSTALCFKCNPLKQPLCKNCLNLGRIKQCPACGGYNLPQRKDCKTCGMVFDDYIASPAGDEMKE